MDPPCGYGRVSTVKMHADKVRKILPEYTDWPDDWLASQPLDVIMRAKRETANADPVKPGKKLEAKHQANYAKAKANPILVKGGLDNRSDILHDS